jgi:hypothetical protein
MITAARVPISDLKTVVMFDSFRLQLYSVNPLYFGRVHIEEVGIRQDGQKDHGRNVTRRRRRLPNGEARRMPSGRADSFAGEQRQDRTPATVMVHE